MNENGSFFDWLKHRWRRISTSDLLYLGFGNVQKAFDHFECQEGKFGTETLGEPLPVWDECH